MFAFELFADKKSRAAIYLEPIHVASHTGQPASVQLPQLLQYSTRLAAQIKDLGQTRRGKFWLGEQTIPSFFFFFFFTELLLAYLSLFCLPLSPAQRGKFDCTIDFKSPGPLVRGQRTAESRLGHHSQPANCDR